MLHALLRLRGSQPAVRLSAEEPARIAQSMLVFRGRDDPFGSVDVGERMVNAVPDAKLRIVDGGHAPWLRRAGQIGLAVADFLRRARHDRTI